MFSYSSTGRGRQLHMSIVPALVAGALYVAVLPAVAHAATWTIQTTPNALEHSALYDIACEPEGLSVCYSVGKQTTEGGVSSPYGQSWNGSTWSTSTPVNPPEATAAELQAVHCISKTLCLAAGSYTKASGTYSLVETRNTAWNYLPSPSAEGASETRLKGISCGAAISCTAVGFSVKEGKVTAFSIRNPLFWSIKAVPQPEGAKASELHGVDCVSTECVAVGSYLDSGGTEWAMAVLYSGTEWTLMTVPKPSESKRSVLLDVSCASITNCAAVGGYRNSKNVQVTFVARWNGTSWTHQTSPNPVGSTNSVFQNVSCTEGAPCVAVGDWYNGKNWQPMAQEWNGAAWAVDTTPTPAGATFSLLEGVACRVKTCLASGWYTNSEGKNKTLGETR